MNFTLQDIGGTTLGFLISTLFFLAPGFLMAWFLNLFDFRQRRPIARLVMALVFSIAISPILLFLLSRLFSMKLALLALGGIAVISLVILILESRNKESTSIHDKKEFKQTSHLGMIIGVIWIIIAFISLIDLQWGNRLYFSLVSYDMTTRVAIGDAITRTGIPPANPGYYPGYPVPIRQFHYYWHILGSIADHIVGMLVNARTAYIASVAWSGLGLIAILSLYLRLRSNRSGWRAKRLALSGIALLCISGLDILPASVMLISLIRNNGQVGLLANIEWWNEMIPSWISSILWTPHHVAALTACLTAMLLFTWKGKPGEQGWIGRSLVAGLAIASAFGLSIWVTLVFSFFWIVWLIIKLSSRRERKEGVWMLFSAVMAVTASAPFVFDLVGIGSNVSSGISLPVMFQVRMFFPFFMALVEKPVLWQSLVYLALLPINYLFELGLFFFVGLIWIFSHGWREIRNERFFSAETLLLIVVIVITSFVRSTTTGSNDLGWRAWLFGQFVLLVWATDILIYFFGKDYQRLRQQPGVRRIQISRNIIGFFIVVGICTTVIGATLLRIWPMLSDAGWDAIPNELSPDRQLGLRTYAARQVYDFIRDETPSNIFIQDNPLIYMDRPRGMYASRAMVAGNHVAFGITPEEFKQFIEPISVIFMNKSWQNWQEIDRICEDASIDLLIFRDTDPIWPELKRISSLRMSLYQNSYYAVFECGKVDF